MPEGEPDKQNCAWKGFRVRKSSQENQNVAINWSRAVRLKRR